MHATIRRYEGVDQRRAAELTSKVNGMLVPKLNELLGFQGHYLIDAGNGVFSSLGLSTRPSKARSRRASSPHGSATRSSSHGCLTTRRSQAARWSPTAAASPAHSLTPRHSREGSACRALTLSARCYVSEDMRTSDEDRESDACPNCGARVESTISGPGEQLREATKRRCPTCGKVLVREVGGEWRIEETPR